MNYIGKQFGVYKVLNETSEKDKSGHIIYEVECTTCHRNSISPLEILIKVEQQPLVNIKELNTINGQIKD